MTSQHEDCGEPTGRKIARKTIKREFRHNVGHLQRNVGDEKAGAPPHLHPIILKKEIDLDGSRDIDLSKVDPDDYTAFVQSVKPDPTTT